MRLGKRVQTDNQEESKCIIVVSGLPRSGTSMMMKILEAGRIPLLIDGVRGADENNPRGYYEFEEVKKLPEGDHSWLERAQGKVVKIVSPLIIFLPGNYNYKIIFIERAIPEILASQRKMLIDRGKAPDSVSEEELSQLFIKHREEALTWAKTKENVEYLVLNYNKILGKPKSSLERLNKFLNRKLDLSSMLAAVDPALYRQREIR